MKRTGLPPIPSQMYSVLGPLPVSVEPLEGELGKTNFERRDVKLSPASGLHTQWQTYWHEAVHLALWDSGVHNFLTLKLEESICDAIGTYMAAAMLAASSEANTPK